MDKETFEQRLKEDETETLQIKGIPGIQNGKCKGPEVMEGKKELDEVQRWGLEEVE